MLNVVWLLQETVEERDWWCREQEAGTKRAKDEGDSTGASGPECERRQSSSCRQTAERQAGSADLLISQ